MIKLRHILILLLAFCPVPGAVGEARGLEQQRQQFERAHNALRAGRVEEFQRLSAGLEDYVLYPYLRYNYLRDRLSQVPESEIRGFLNRHPESPLAEWLRGRWLQHLARQGRWQAFLDYYTPQRDVVLQCQKLQARIQTGAEAEVPENALALWLVGKSQVKECDPAFAVLARSPLLTEERVWERIGLAMNEGETGLARYLSRRLDADGQRWVELWVEMHGNPQTTLRHARLQQDHPMAREILVHGIKRLARQDAALAAQRWQELMQRYAFDTRQRSEAWKAVGMYATFRDLPQAAAWLDGIDEAHADEAVYRWRFKAALTTRDWQRLLKWTAAEPPEGFNALRWRYWRARALEETGQGRAAEPLYRQLALERDYYGFIAADRLSLPYNMIHRPTEFTAAEEAAVLANPGVARSRELRAIGWITSARSEWQHTIGRMEERDLQIAAALASRWGWHDRAIFTLGRAQSLDDLQLRFPTPYKEPVLEQARRNGLEPSLIYSIIRNESAFIEDVKSPAGALGLMQVMPATGRQTAKQMGIGFKDSDLTVAEKNLPIGSAYLRQMLSRYGGQVHLAAAAYNAGPGRVNAWLPKDECLPADLWIDMIPFTETRRYVRRILFTQAVYEWHLAGAATPLARRMTAVQPKTAVSAQLACALSAEDTEELASGG